MRRGLAIAAALVLLPVVALAGHPMPGLSLDWMEDEWHSLPGSTYVFRLLCELSVTTGARCTGSRHTTITTTRASTATCLDSSVVAANEACIGEDGIECFASGNGGRTAADVHTVSTAGWPTAAGRVVLTYTSGGLVASGNRRLLDSGLLANGVDFTLDTSDRVVFCVSSGGTRTCSTFSSALTSTHTIIGEWGGGFLRLYVDGSQVGAAVATSSPLGHNALAYIGSRSTGAEQINGSVKLLSVSSP